MMMKARATKAEVPMARPSSPSVRLTALLEPTITTTAKQE